MITISDIENALANDEVQLFQLESIVRKARLQAKANGVNAPRSGLTVPFIKHDSEAHGTRPTKDGATFRISCKCGFLVRKWTWEQAIEASRLHDKLSGWKRPGVYKG